MSLDASGRPIGMSHYLGPDHPHWPPLWRHMIDPPAAVTVNGDSEHLCRRILAIVGTRRATNRGRAVAAGLAMGLAQAGWVIASGLALGIDGAAHRGALQAVDGATIAVMATGSNLTYPPQHRSLRGKIEARGCALTEHPDGEKPRKYYFPQRNRLIAGMAEGVIVVEAPLKSGALITAYMALDMGREVMAVPGPIDFEQSRGCHKLLKEGAALVESLQDIHDILPPPVTAGNRGSANDGQGELELAAAGDAGRWIWERLDLEGVTQAELRSRWTGSATAFGEGLAALEMKKVIQRLPGGRLARKIWRP